MNRTIEARMGRMMRESAADPQLAGMKEWLAATLARLLDGAEPAAVDQDDDLHLLEQALVLAPGYPGGNACELCTLLETVFDGVRIRLSDREDVARRILDHWSRVLD